MYAIFEIQEALEENESGGLPVSSLSISAICLILYCHLIIYYCYKKYSLIGMVAVTFITTCHLQACLIAVINLLHDYTYLKKICYLKITILSSTINRTYTLASSVTSSLVILAKVSSSGVPANTRMRVSWSISGTLG